MLPGAHSQVAPKGGSSSQRVLARLVAPAAVYAVCAGVYVLTLGSRWDHPAPDGHFLHLANSFLHGQLSVLGDRPPGTNDWALYGGRWFVSFPPFPAVLLMPLVALWGPALPDRLFWALFAGLGPALLFVLLRQLRESGRSLRTVREDALLAGLFAFGSVYYFSAVQGSVWFAAHVVAVPLLVLYLLCSLDARRPLLAGLCLGLCFMTRVTTLLAMPFFLIQALEASRPAGAGLLGHTGTGLGDGAGWPQRLRDWLADVDWRQAARSIAWFASPLLVIGILAMVLNWARFDDPFEFGHRYLQIRWRPRIETWGLFNYHYLGRNFAIFMASLPWFMNAAPYVRISRHGLALWFTTPQLLLTLWPRRVHATLIGLYIAVGCVALLNLLYQNSGWVQFGYRFALDYMPMLFMLLALGGRRFGVGFYALLLFAVVVNTFGAVTFDRMPQFYDRDSTQRIIFQPD